TRHETEAQVLGDLTNFAQERQVENQVVIFTGTQKLQELIDDEQDAMTGMNLGEGRHHFLESGLVVDDLIGGREGIVDALTLQKALQLLRDDVAQRHLTGDFDSMYLELAGNRARSG